MKPLALHFSYTFAIGLQKCVSSVSQAGDGQLTLCGEFEARKEEFEARRRAEEADLA